MSVRIPCQVRQVVINSKAQKLTLALTIVSFHRFTRDEDIAAALKVSTRITREARTIQRTIVPIIFHVSFRLN